MSLLAEPRRRQMISRNPQGKNDSNLWKQYGTKLMQKSGWTDGDGLGHDRQGATDHLQIQFKDDSRGLGCSIQYDQNWLAHGDDFNALLASLNAEHGETKPEENSKECTDVEVIELQQPVCLEEKSKGAKGRIHYHKFTRGKDLSSRSADEISKIFGGKMPKKKSGLVNAAEELSKSECVPVEEKVTGLKTFQSNESISDYFAKKMALKKINCVNVVASTDTEESFNLSEKNFESNSEKEERSFTDGTHGEFGTPGTTIGEVERRQKSKKRRTESAEATLQPEEMESELAAHEISNFVEEEQDTKEERRRKRRLRKAALAAEASLSPLAESVQTASCDSGLFESQEERRLRKLARRAKKSQSVADLVESDFVNPSVGPTTEISVCVEEMAAELEMTTDVVNGDSMAEALPNASFFPRPPFGTSMNAVRHHLRQIPLEARAAMFPGANIFDVNGYGDELFF